MKKFSENEILDLFKKQVLSVDSHNTEISQYHAPNNAIHSLEKSMMPCFLPKIANKGSLDIGKISKYRKGYSSFYLLPGYFLNQNYHYISNHETDSLLEKWYSVVKKNINNNTLEYYTEEELIEANKIARELYGLTYYYHFKENKLIEKIKNPLNEEFWQLYLAARHTYDFYSEYSKVEHFTQEYPHNEKKVKEHIIDFLESIDDLEKLGEVLLKTKKYHRIEKKEQDLYLSAIEKLVPKYSLKELTKIQSFSVLEFSIAKLNPDEIIKNLKLLEFCQFDIVKDIFLKFFSESKNKKILNYVEKVLIENNMLEKTQDLVEKENFFEDKSDLIVYRKSLNINLKSLRVKTDNDLFVAINLLEMTIINEEKNNNNLNVTMEINEDFTQAKMIIESTDKEVVSLFRKRLDMYVNTVFNKESLNAMWSKISRRAGRNMIHHSKNKKYQKMFEKISLPLLLNNELKTNESNNKKIKKI